MGGDPLQESEVQGARHRVRSGALPPVCGLYLRVVVIEKAVGLVDQPLGMLGVPGRERLCRLSDQMRHPIAIRGQLLTIRGVLEIGAILDQVVNVLGVVADALRVLHRAHIGEDERQVDRVLHRGVNHQLPPDVLLGNVDVTIGAL